MSEEQPRITPEIQAELERLGVAHLPWKPDPYGAAVIQAWNHVVLVCESNVVRAGVGFIDGTAWGFRNYRGKEAQKWLKLAAARYGTKLKTNTKGRKKTK